MNDDGTQNISLTTSQAAQILMEEDMRRWMGHHHPKIADRIGNMKHCRTSYHELVQSLRLDRQPKQAAALLIGNGLIRSANSSQPPAAEKQQLIISEIDAGRAVLNNVHNHLQHKPSSELLSTGMMLTEARRKNIISKLKRGDNVEQEPTPLIYPHVPVHHTTSLGRIEDAPSPNKSFRPQWGHYSTMQARWKYIQPQTKQLLPSSETIAPSRVSGSFPVNNSTISGNIVEVQNYLSRSQLSAASIVDAMKAQRR